ncbi:MAG: biotin/lipoyl-containing protein [Myxococcota bacterium]
MSDRVVLRARPGDDGETRLESASVGIFTARVGSGEVVTAGQHVGTLEVLGVSRDLRVPKGVSGRISAIAGSGKARVPVQFGEALLTLTAAVDVGGAAELGGSAAAVAGTLAFEAPMSGRFYSRPSPNDPAFVSAGDTVRRGQTVGLLEVMKTFNRLVYQGDDLPEVAVVESVVPADGDDVVRGDVLLGLRPAGD